MATDTPPAQPGLTGQVMLYGDPEPLDAARHANLGMMSTDRPFAFAATQHFIPLNVTEFSMAALNYPIIFAGETYTPLAVMGLRNGENLFIAPDGRFRVGAYIPAFLRRYPFVGARDPRADRTIVCIDRAFPFWSETAPDVKLFENGEPTAFTQSCIDFCGQFDHEQTLTETFVKTLRDLDLLTNQQTAYTPRLADGSAGKPQPIAEYFAVSQEKFRALPAEKLVELRDSGALQQIYAHLISLIGWDRTIHESLERQPQPVVANA
jgi:hypothetical protein